MGGSCEAEALLRSYSIGKLFKLLKVFGIMVYPSIEQVGQQATRIVSSERRSHKCLAPGLRHFQLRG